MPVLARHTDRPRSTLVGLVALALGMTLLIAPAIGRAAGLLPYSTEAEARTDQLGTTSNDLSGATYNAARDRVLVVDNFTNRIHEYDTDAAYALVVGPRRTIDVTVGGTDLEGITWIRDDEYAVLSEDAGTIELLTIPDDVGVTTIGSSSGTISTFITESPDGFGAEGLAVDRGASNGVTVFWVAREKPPTIYQIDSLGNLRAAVPVPVLDASGVYASPDDDTVFVLSDESQQVVQLEVDPGAGTATIVSTMALPDFEQAEGIAFTPDLSSMYVFGESPTTGLTHARYTGPVVPTPTATPEPTATATPAPTATSTPAPTATATPDPTATPAPTATVAPTATAAATPTSAPTVAPTSTAAPAATVAPTVGIAAAPADPGPFSSAPSSASGAFGFGTDASAGEIDAPGVGGATGGDTTGLAVTGRTTDPVASLGIALLGVGAAILVAGRRRND